MCPVQEVSLAVLRALQTLGMLQSELCYSMEEDSETAICRNPPTRSFTADRNNLTDS